ncbi:hypothetical protein FQN52_004094 [Onygenales sp. PD_12]|nr:hypothetical protein FQN52_004094 [Onygenales sp. PD_12]
MLSTLTYRSKETAREEENQIKDEHATDTPQSEKRAEVAISPFAKVPMEIFQDITKHLPPVDKMCLALTCKSLLNVIDGDKSLQRSHQFQLGKWINPARLWPCWSGLSFRACPKHISTFLRLLETPQYSFCSACCKLHHVSEFVEKQDGSQVDQVCRFSTWQRVFHSCPCFWATFQDKQELLEAYFALPRYPLETPRNTNPTLWEHQCSHVIQGVTIQMERKPLIAKDGFLSIEFKYTVPIRYGFDPFDFDLQKIRKIENIFCPHYTLGRILIHTARCERCTCPPTREGMLHCKDCRTSSEAIESTEPKGYKVDFQRLQALGGAGLSAWSFWWKREWPAGGVEIYRWARIPMTGNRLKELEPTG